MKLWEARLIQETVVRLVLLLTGHQAQLPAAAEPAIDVQINLIAVSLQMSPPDRRGSPVMAVIRADLTSPPAEQSLCPLG